MSPSGPVRRRLDVVLVERGCFDTRAQAQDAIAAGLVTVDGMIARRASQNVAESAAINTAPAHPWVSRAGLKLEAGLRGFGVDPTGLFVLDVGASTGGFVDVLLAQGARHVVAVDVGRDQLHPRLAGDPRVTRLEGLDARTLTPAHLPQPPDLIVCDASFIGLEKVLSQPLALAGTRAHLIALFKPQFQVGPQHVGKNGLVQNQDQISQALARSEAWLCAQGWPVRARLASPITGRGGNQETLLHAVRGEAI